MSKMTSERCVELVVKAKGGSPADWKRRSKSKRGCDVVRVFENVKTGDRVEVVDTGAGISLGAGGALRTFSVKVTKEQLAGALAYGWTKAPYFRDGFDGKPRKGMGAEKFLEVTGFDGGKGITPTVIGDLEAVQFDTENREWQKKEAYEGFEAVTGFNTTPGGLTYLGVAAGGDWECPLLYVLYWDGQELRGYVPRGGNTWNTDTMTAYGSEGDKLDSEEEAEKANAANLKRRFGVDEKNSALPDARAIVQDIDAAITFAPGPSVPMKGMDDVDWEALGRIEEEREAEEKEFEKQQAARNQARQAQTAGKCSCGSCGGPREERPPRPVDPQYLGLELGRVRELAVKLGAGAAELERGLDAPDAKEKARWLRDMVLRELVTRLVQVTLEVERK